MFPVGCQSLRTADGGHYLIHSYDFAPLAALCLPAAHLYAKLAATAPHSLRMPSHI